MSERREALEGLRDELLGRIDGADDRALAGLGRLLVDVLRELDELPKAKGSSVDEFSARVAARRAGAAGPGASAG